MIREINSQDWPIFCQRVTEQRSGAMVKLEVIETDGVKTEQIADAILESMLFDATDACSDVITLRLKAAPEIIHKIIDPIQFRLHSSATPDDFNVIQIVAENGITIITVHPAIHAQMLVGLKNI